MTATAAPPVRADIVERLRLHDPTVVVGGSARTNLYLGVERCLDEADQRARVLQAVLGTAGPGIVYVRTRKATEAYAAELAEAGLAAAAYHAGLGKRVRDAVQEDFMAGRLEVMVATSAFGMGVDKPDIRFVVHAQAPESPDSYYQEVGRAGRDRAPAVGLLYFRPEDLSLARFFTAARPEPMEVAAVLDAWPDGHRARPARAGRADRAERPQARPDPQPGGRGPHQRAPAERGRGDRAGRGLPQAAGVADRADAGVRGDPALPAAVPARVLRRADRRAVRGLRQLPGRDRPTDEPDAGPFRVEQPVRHPAFGAGVVMGVEGDELTVLFDDVGYKTLSLPTVVEQELLTPA